MNSINVKSLLSKNSVKNGLWLYILQACNTIIPLIILPYITRVLGSAGYGVFSVAFNIVAYLQVVVEYGFGMSATREVVLSNRNKTKINHIFTAVITARIILLLICAVFGGIYLMLKWDNYELRLSFLALFLCLLGYVIQLNWLFQGMEEMKYISITNIIARTVSLVLTFTLVKDKSDLLVYCILYALSPIISGTIGLFIAIRKYKIKIVKLTLHDVLVELKRGWYVFTTQISSKVFGAIGITFLGFFSTESEVGVYSAIQKIATVMILAWSPISQVLYPIVSKKITESFDEGFAFVKRIRKIILLLFGVACLCGCMLSKIIVGIAFGEEYVGCFYWLIPQLIWVLVAIINNFNGIQVLLGSGHDREYSNCFQIGVLITITVNLLFVWLWKGNGACCASLISESLLGIMLYKQVKLLEKDNQKTIKGVI